VVACQPLLPLSCACNQTGMCATPVFLCLALGLICSDVALTQHSSGVIYESDIVFPKDDSYERPIIPSTSPPSKSKTPNNNSTKSSTADSCVLPTLPPGVKQFTSVGKVISPGQRVENNEEVRIYCSEGYEEASDGRVVTMCKQSSWDQPIPQCYKVLCPRLSSASLELQCFHGSSLIPQSCSEPQQVNTTVTIKCKEYYRSLSHFTSPVCGKNGAWSTPLPTCEPKCGLSNLNSLDVTPTILNGKVARAGNFPWQTAIFHNVSGVWTNVCGGSLISSRHVLTAAHCVTTDCRICQTTTLNVSQVMVALGKSHRQWSTPPESDEIRRSVRYIFFI